MSYEEMLERVKMLEYIGNEKKADAAIKAIWGIIASSVKKPVAAEITSELPEPLTEEKLRRHQARKLKINSENFINEISRKFKILPKQAKELVEVVLHLGEQSLQEQSRAKLKESVPEDVAVLL